MRDDREEGFSVPHPRDVPLSARLPGDLAAALAHGKHREQQGHSAIGEQPRIGESFVWMRAEPGKWGEQVEQIVDVIGPAKRNDDGDPIEWVVVWNDWTGDAIVPRADARAEKRETVVKREGDRWVRAHE